MMDNKQQSSLPAGTYGFIGIGVMGFPMAQNLRKRMPPDSKLVICEVVESQVTKFIKEANADDNIEVAASPKEVAKQADIIITMLPKGPHVREVFTHPETGLLAANISRSIFFMECSTIETRTSNEIDKVVSEAGHRFVDAPVSGGPNGAQSATLTFMIGGDEKLFQEARPLAEAMGKKENIYHCGKQGAGLATKQINNYLSAVSMLGAAEAFNMGRLYGLNPKTLASVINVSTGMCYNSSAQNPVKGVTSTAASAKDFQGGFSIELCKGVLEMATALSDQVGAKSVLKDVVLQTFEEASQDPRCKGKDYRSIYLHIADIEQSENHT